MPLTLAEHPIPVGVVSNSYALVQHADLATKCLEGIRKAGIDPKLLRCEIGLTPLGEWMNLRVSLPDDFRVPGEKNVDDRVGLRLEAFNSVDRSSRLVVLFSWLRLVCSNGMTISETFTELRDVHDERLTLEPLPEIIGRGLATAESDKRRLRQWASTPVASEGIEPWVNKSVSDSWGKKAACRVFHICRSGQDVDLADPFAGGRASEKVVKPAGPVPGAAIPAKTLFDVSQALSWVATRRNDSEERLLWQQQIPELVSSLSIYRSR
jgi:hypothetical protein